MSRSKSLTEEIQELAKAPTPPSLEHLFKLARQRGWRVNNLFQRMDGMWQANLRDRSATLFFEFAFGPTAPDAMTNALVKANQCAAVMPGDQACDDELSPRDIGCPRGGPRSDSATIVNVDTTESDADADDDLIG